MFAQGSLIDRLNKWFNASRPISNKQVILEESMDVEKKFAEHFDEKNHDYLENHYKKFVEVDYPKYIAEKNYSYIDPLEFPAKDRPRYALALSGGGIRSAAFGIGVIQALNNSDLNPKKPTLFSKLSYLSTVSGGGYTGAALTWFMKKWGEFPFGELATFCGSKKSEKKSNKILSYIRLHGKYLTPPGLPIISLIGSVLGSALHSLIAYTLLLSLIMFGLISAINTDFLQGLLQTQHDISPTYTVIVNTLDKILPVNLKYAYEPHRVTFSLFFLDLLFLNIFLFALTPVAYGFTSIFTQIFTLNYAYRISIQRALGIFITVGFCCFVLMLLPLQVIVLSGTTIEITDAAFWGSGGAGLGALIMAVTEFRRRLKPIPESNSISANTTRFLVVAAFIYFILVATYIIGEKLYDLSLQAYILQPVKDYPVHCWFVAITLFFGILVNINHISPHKMYRDRLMDTFLRDPDIDPDASLSLKGNLANKTLLSDLDKQPHWSPYHLINTNVILNNSFNQQYSGRLGDSFLMSSKYCSSDATGYVPTTQFALGSMTLATAMSISGAAANPHSGVGGLGNSTSPFTSFLMTFFGFRLGYWVNNPANFLGRWRPLQRPNYISPGAGSLFGFGHKEKSMYIELSDGGHFDNTGIYELVRRRSPWIILADGSTDLKTTFEDFGNALSRIRIDFGVNVRFLDSHLDLSGLIPGSQALHKENKDELSGNTIFDEKYCLAERGYAIGDIIYPDVPADPDIPGDLGHPAFVGTLVFIKATMTRGLPGDIYAYKSDHPQFPNEPTSDQFFDERQFESYRELGYQITKQLVLNASAMQRLP